MALSSLRRVLAFVVPPALVAMALLFFAYPPLNEETGSECSALELRIRDNASHDSAGFLIVGQLYGSSSSEPSGAAYARDRHPLLPAAVGCAYEYWRIAFNPPPPASPAATTPAAAPIPPAASPAPPSIAAAPSATTPIVAAPPSLARPVMPEPLASVIARDITPNGDPISPATVFTLPMNAVAIRVATRGQTAGLRFQLMQGKAVLATCPAERADETAWCKFNAQLRKGFYSIVLIAGRDLLGQFPFTVIGR
jgi:hypothetical protein